MAISARMRRLQSDYEQIKKDFDGNPYIIVTPVGDEFPEQYHVTYNVNGIYLLPDGRVETLNRHEVEITLHADYPRYKPLCKILTPIWHPNFRDGQICIGDIWGAGESLSDIIINIGDMIQYKSWNSFSPLSAEAAKWAIENRHLFPVGNINLNLVDYSKDKDTVDITLPGEEPAEQPTASYEAPAAPASDDGNDFEITADELAGIEFIPTAQRMQTLNGANTVKGGKVNFKTVLVKGLIWALIGALVGFGIGELVSLAITPAALSRLMGRSYLATYYEENELAEKEASTFYKEYEAFCKQNNKEPDDYDLYNWFMNDASSEAQDHFESYLEHNNAANEAIGNSYQYEFNSNENALKAAVKLNTRLNVAIWSAVIALFIGLFLGIGEGVYYGSASKAFKYAAIGAGISLGIGFVSGFLAQMMYGFVMDFTDNFFLLAVIRGLGWAIMGIGIGLAAGLIRPNGKRILFCTLGGMAGAFIGGTLFDFVLKIIPQDIVARGIALVIMGALIGVGVGLLEQFAKQAWLKVVRGEFEGKEYLVFAGTTSIGNNARNTIVLFKDKLVGPHHCDIVLEGTRYYIVDCGTPMGTVVNGMPITRRELRRGDAISIGNSVLVFNTK